MQVRMEVLLLQQYPSLISVMISWIYKKMGAPIFAKVKWIGVVIVNVKLFWDHVLEKGSKCFILNIWRSKMQID